jgi:hypothetical protein
MIELTSFAAGCRSTLGAAMLVVCLILTACGSGGSTKHALAQKQLTCVTPAGNHVRVAERADGTPKLPVLDRKSGAALACEAVSVLPPATKGSPKAVAASVGSAKAVAAAGPGENPTPDVPACIPQVTIEHPEESVCLFWYNETKLSLTLWSASCGDGHISPGTYDAYPGESYSALPTNSFLTQDFDPSEGEGGNTRVQCTITWNDKGGGPAFEASFNYDEFSSPTKLALSATASPNYATPISAFVSPGSNNNTASIVLCDTEDPLCSGHYKCPEGSDWMSCKFGSSPSKTEQNSPKLSQVSMPGSHDAGTYALKEPTVLEACGGKGWEEYVPSVTAAWAKTQASDTYDQASAGSRYFDIRGIDDSGMRHCHTLGAASWSDIFGVNLDTTIEGTAHGLVQFGEQHPGELMIVDFTHLYNSATPGTAAYTATVSDLKSLCEHAIRPEAFADPGATPINELRSYAIEHKKPFLFYMTTSDSADSTKPFAVYNAAVPNCLFSEGTGKSSEGIVNTSYDEEEDADPLNDYVSPLTKPGTSFSNFQSAQYNLAQNEYQKIPASGNESLWVTQYIWDYAEINVNTVAYIATDSLESWTESGLANSYTYDALPPLGSFLTPAFPVGAQFVTGLQRAALSRGPTAEAQIQPPNIVMVDDIASSFWSWGSPSRAIATPATIWNQNYSEPVRVTVTISTSGTSSGTVSDEDGFLKCSSGSSSPCSAVVPVGDVLFANPGNESESGGFSGSACATGGGPCTVTGAGSVTASFRNFTILPPRSLSLTAENASVAAVWPPAESDGGYPISSYTVTVFEQGDQKAQHPLGECTIQPESTPSAMLFCSISSLKNGTSYFASVSATNGAQKRSSLTFSNFATPSSSASGTGG